MFAVAAGWFALTFLSLLAWVAAVAVAGRAKMANRVEMLLAASLVWVGIVDVPTYALGWMNLLYRPVLGALSFALSMTILALCRGGLSWGAYLAKILRNIGQLARFPFDALVRLAKMRSLALLGAVVCAGVIGWTGWLSYLGPPSGWDGLWYHDTMVGFAIQNHGFRVVEVPQSLAHVNSFPRIVETLNLWFVFFTDRRLLEFSNCIMSVPLLAALYVLIRRYTTDSAYAVGGACAILLMPGVVLQLRSTYIDLSCAALYVAALHFSTRQQVRLRDGWLAALALGLTLGTKFFALAQVPLMGVVILVRLVAQHGRARPWPTLATVVGGLAMVVAIGGPNYIRNWRQHHNPIWPYQEDSAVQQVSASADVVSVSLTQTTGRLIGDMLSQPIPGRDWPDTKQHGYGLGLPILILPLGIAGLLAALVVGATGLFRPVVGFDKTKNLLYTTIPALVTLPMSPMLAYARYNHHITVAFLLLASWFIGRPSCLRIREGVSSALIVTSLVLLWWAAPRWCMTYDQAKELSAMTPLQRAAAHVVDFLPEPQAVLARETELKRGDIVVFTDHYMFPAVNWNERYDNRVVWVSTELGPEQTLERAIQIGAKWISVVNASAEYSLLRSRPSVWQEVGVLSTTSPAQIAFRRVGAS